MRFFYVDILRVPHVMKSLFLTERLAPDRRSKLERRPSLEVLEGRMVLNAAGASAEAHKAVIESLGLHGRGFRPPLIGTIQGQITNATTGKALRNVKVQLIDASGNIVQT